MRCVRGLRTSSGALGALRHDYLLSSGDGTPTSATVALNGAVLGVAPDGSLPPLPPVEVVGPGAPALTLPPLTFGFFVFPNASVAACQGGAPP
jgi:heparanase 1